MLYILTLQARKPYNQVMEDTEITQRRGPGRPRTITALDVAFLGKHVVSQRTLQSVADEYGVSRETVRQHVAKFPFRRSADVSRDFLGEFGVWADCWPDVPMRYGAMLEWYERIRPDTQRENEK